MYLFFFTAFLLCKLNGALQYFNGSENCGIIAPKLVRYIYGGKYSMIEQWPWQIHLKITNANIENFKDSEHANCGGSLIDDNWIITAAHCFSNLKDPKIFILHGHNFTRHEHYKQIKYEKIFIHPNYVEYTGNNEYSTNDIALIKVATKSKFRKGISKPCLPKKNAIVPQNSVCYITGFGASSKNDNESVKRLREGKVTIKPDRTCVKTLQLPYYDSETMMCAGKSKGTKANSCQGDSGGPLVCEGSFGNTKQNRWYLFGITSFGALDCSSYTISVYTKVSNYVEWVIDTVNNNIR